MNDTVTWLRQRGLEAEVFTSDEVVGHRRTPFSYISSNRCRRALRERLESYDPDIVHLHNFYHELSPGILATLGRWKRGARSDGRTRRVVMTAHDYHLVCPNSGLLRCDARGVNQVNPRRLPHLWYLMLARWDRRSEFHSLLKIAQHVWNYRICRRHRAIDLVICPSRFMQKLMRRFGTRYLPHPVEPVAASGDKPSGELRMVFAGRVEPEKGLVEFIELLPADFAGRLEVIGAGASLEHCVDACYKHGFADRMDFAGELPHSEAVARITASHVLVLPSLCPENCPMSLVEAMATGTNVLVAGIGGMKEMVESSGIGFSFGQGDARSLGSALRKIRERFEAGTLNDFDVAPFLAQRTKESYLDGLLSIYRMQAEDPAPADVADGGAG